MRTRNGVSSGIRIPQEFFLKNQILSVLLNHYLPEVQLQFSQLPTVDFHETVKKVEQMGMNLQVKDSCIQEPFHRLLSLITAAKPHTAD